MIFITHACIACDLCRLECPIDCISEGDPVYVIDNKICIECRNYYDMPNCIKVCPVDAIIEVEGG